MKKITFSALVTFLVVLFNYNVSYGQSPASYDTSTTASDGKIRLQFEGGNNSKDLETACLFINNNGGFACSGGSIEIDGVIYTFESVNNGIVTYSAGAAVPDVPTDFEIAVGLGVGDEHHEQSAVLDRRRRLGVL